MVRLASGLFVFIAIIFILWIGKSILIPIIWALLIWFLLRGLRQSISRIPLVKKYVPSMIISILTLVIFVGGYFLLMEILLSNIQFLIKQLPKYENNFESIIQFAKDYFRTDPNALGLGDINTGSLMKVLNQLTSSLAGFMGNIFMVILYIIFIFSEESNFDEKIKNIFPDSQTRENYLSVLKEISGSISNYLWLKTLISLCTAGASWIILAIIGVDAAMFWAFLIFILNFIPNVGSLIATAFPSLMALIQYNDLLHPLLVLGLIGMTQVVVGNVLEPKLMGKSLNLSSFVVILALVFWSLLWGITGAILSVPIMVVLMILFKNIKGTEAVAKALSEKGTLN
jgi:predicted PurR-regulated permease PerM